MKEKKFPKVVVGVLIFNDERKIFLGRSKKWSDKWAVPGGHLEWGETFFECVKREVKEETNMEVKDVKFVGLQENIFSEAYFKPKHMVFLDYSCNAVTYDIILNDEIQEYKWVKPKEALSKYDLTDGTNKIIKNYLSA